MCVYSRRCPWYMFRCAYGACTKISSICNGVYDCVDKSDEPPQHSCRLNYVPPPPTSGPIMTTRSSTKHYTPFPYPVGTTTPTKHPHNPHTPSTPSSTKYHTPKSTTTKTTSTTKQYTPYPFNPSSERLTPKASATIQSTKAHTPFTVVNSNSLYTTQPPSSTPTSERASTR